MNFDIEAIKRKMLVKYPFFGSVVANVEYKENKNVPTAGTDGKIIHYNPEFLEKLSTPEQTFIFAHEVCHIAFNHIFRSEGKDAYVWNIATDAVINAFLKRDGLHMVEGGVDMADAINYDAEQLYEKLLKEKQQEQNGQKSSGEQSQKENGESQGTGSQSQNNIGQSQNSDGQSSGNSPSGEETGQKEQSNSSSGNGESSETEKKQDVGHDTHSMWDEAIKKHKEQQNKQGKKENIFDKLFNKDKQDDKEKKSEIEKKQEETKQLGEKEAFKKNLEEKKKELEELKKALSKQAMGAGTTTNSNIRNISDIGSAKPLIDWRYILREAIKYDVDWSYKNATIEDGVISANLEEQPIPETEIVLDTSGSIDETLLKNFLRECKNILKHSRLKVGCFDTEFYGFHDIRTDDDIENMKFVGGGGTNFNVAINAFSRRVENKIIFTDGEATMPNISLDAIWIVFGGTRINPKGGKVIHIDDNQLNKLYSYEQDNSYKGRSR